MREERKKRGFGRAAAVIGLAAALCGCAPAKYVPVETVRTEYIEADTAAIYNRLALLFESLRQSESRSDSLIDHTKETVVLKENGDTARHDRERIIYRATAREKELERMVRQQDSVINAIRAQLSSAKIDTIREPYPVEKELTRWQKAKMDFGGMAFGVSGAALIFILTAAIRKIHKQT